MTTRKDLAMAAKAWPFEEARKLLERVKRDEAAGKAKPYVLFETGYGPSGLPHIGTFGEVARTSWVRRAFQELSDKPTRLIAFSDDMDGMRKIPENIPNHEMLREHIQKPLTAVPDPFGTHESFAHHNNARLRSFLDGFGFDYEFMSATDAYKSGKFDATLLKALKVYDQIMAIMLPTLGEERRRTYSPFLPISPKSGRVLYVPLKRHDAAAGTITFDDEDGEEITQTVTGGHAKMQWKPDFGMRWAALGIDFEMFGKDHLPNQPLYAKICKALGAEPPINYVYELFLDEVGEKISKTKGNGIAVEQWLTYSAPESLALFMYNKPRTAKRLFFDAIPKEVDDYVAHLDKYQTQNEAERLENPVWHIHAGNPPQEAWPVSFALLLNLVSASSASTPEILWAFIRQYAPRANPKDNPSLDRLVGYAIRYYEDFVKPKKKYRTPTDKERAAMEDLAAAFDQLGNITDNEAVQFQVYEVGKKHQFEPLRDWFKALYEVLFGQDQGPRFGSFAALYGVTNTAKLIREGLAGKFLA
ncbi:MAG: lysine--tRNA ligase [Alphaproteobacteria bacterium]|nr:lysine--tRNA ligase [Alphaproteobacteria bacterium]